MEVTLIFDQPVEYYVVIVAMSLRMMNTQLKGVPFWKIVVNTFISVLLTLGLSKDVGPYLIGGEIGAAVVIMAFGLTMLNGFAKIVASNDFLEGIIDRLIGIGGKK